MQTEKAKSSHFDRTRGLKNQIFPTSVINQDIIGALDIIQEFIGDYWGTT